MEAPDLLPAARDVVSVTGVVAELTVSTSDPQVLVLSLIHILPPP